MLRGSTNSSATKSDARQPHEHPDYIADAIDHERAHGIRTTTAMLGRGAPGVAHLLIAASVHRQARLAGVHVPLLALLEETR
ncbi:hypothetical protein K8Z61_18390 [Nocardioides sp. TRM66260-LWL]|uniref:hypothetical protein n=1 Tax=Nocardioides sp. TRM66260-LWL TaxID=2874478 RepID=UPI001CC3E2A8|nr:hypothetical protein [Nocardioides sp. TRM66260-LWL]MBZ5736464.1 hypothetical protein [Nocardioides sp. TRM66260-LWL]